ncbi:MAG: short chain dehydrogenase [Oceanicaulis sp.]|uniref:Short chain dehydrogenase n=1 Tax=Maricaulis virginensis TaxID=144022 RepID=A0A9W6MMU3_9PROT|nr:SDR family oxidoreductase [Maricaulis virginensis]MAZ91943.1 short chain dehydrogenase [Maricaulis sp.]MBI74475.1 short chain dehydrogenase [Oceanicaulis sp.]GLK51373.1 short chain dehydrogenase [Maricaulis virginensis]|tara:strand:- start:1457 stop:2215 length:759 start_codon:yes stop_codon:yes gene_type:complete
MSDKIALVTGGGKRLGAKIAAALGADGWHVVVHYNTSGTDAEAVAAAIRDAGGSADTVRFDMDDTAGIAGFMDGVGRVDALINSASIFEPDRPETVTPVQLEHTLRVNLVAPVLLASAMARRHEDRASGCIINLLDQKLFNLNPDFFSYTLAKQALLGATTTMAMAFAPRVRVNGVAPGITLPSGGQSPEEFARAHRMNPMQGGSTPEDIIRAVRFILATPSMTGETIIVDGGQHLDARDGDVMYAAGVPED